jgi:predicted thioesterase
LDYDNDDAKRESLMHPVPVGTRGIYEFAVERKDLACTIEPSLPPVLATAIVSLSMELAAMDAIKAYLEPGDTTVGAIVNMTHTAATPEGWKVRAEAKVTRCYGQQIEFSVCAFDEKEEIGNGTHMRAVVDRAKFDERLAAKVKSRP